MWPLFHHFPAPCGLCRHSCEPVTTIITFEGPNKAIGHHKVAESQQFLTQSNRWYHRLSPNQIDHTTITRLLVKAGRTYREAERPMPMEIPMADCTQNPETKNDIWSCDRISYFVKNVCICLWMNECMYAQVTSSTMKSLAHCGRGREKSGKIEGHKMRWS